MKAYRSAPLSVLAYLPVLAAGAWLLHADDRAWRLVAAADAAAAVWLIVLHTLARRPFPSSDERPLFAALLILNGTIVRLVLAWKFSGNYDSVSWEIAAERFRQGIGPYTGNARYNYSPVWYWTLGLLDALRRPFPGVSLHAAVGTFLTAVDLALAAVLARWVKGGRADWAVPALFFYFNPVCFLLTGYHGQTENLALLGALAGLRAFRNGAGRAGAWSWWAGCTAGLLVKQIVFFHLAAAVQSGLGRRVERAIGLVLSAGIFAMTLAPYWGGASEDIVRSVLSYAGRPEPYGLAAWGPARWIFLPAFAAFFAVSGRFAPEKRLLLLTLFFLAAMPGAGVQYFALPVALASLAPGPGFAVYTAVTAAFLTGSAYNLALPALAFVPWNAVWAAVMFWLAAEWRRRPFESGFLLPESNRRV